jgi:N-formylglutamate deformylase
MTDCSSVLHVEKAAEPCVPLFMDSPHSGTVYPEDFQFVCPQAWLRQTEDSFVDQLFTAAPTQGIRFQKALFARSYIDVNRAEDDIDPRLIEGEWPTPLAPTERSAAGHGLIRHLCRGAAVYSTRLPVIVIQHRIENFYRPYHQSLRSTLDELRQGFGVVWHINCHSMPSSLNLSNTPDFILGDRDGTSCEKPFTAFIGQTLQAMGYRVGHNDPYKGAEILNRYGRPADAVHSLQLEINRALYMDEKTLHPNAGFEKLRQNLDMLMGEWREWAMRRANPQKLAAE